MIVKEDFLLEIVALSGNELEKALPNSPEDGFTRSEVTYIRDHQEHTFRLLYVRYFEELVLKEIPYSEQPLFYVDEAPCYLRDLAAFLYLMTNPQEIGKKEVYIYEEAQFINIFSQVNWEQVQTIFSSYTRGGKTAIRSPLDIISQPQ